MDRAPSQPGEENTWESDFASERSDAKKKRADVESTEIAREVDSISSSAQKVRGEEDESYAHYLAMYGRDASPKQWPLELWHRAATSSSPAMLTRRVRAGFLHVLVLLTLAAVTLIERDSDAPASDVETAATVDLLAAPVDRLPLPLVASLPPTIVARQPPAQLPRPKPQTAIRPAPRVSSAAPPPSPIWSAERSPNPPPRAATVVPSHLDTTESVLTPLPRVAVDDPALVLPAPASPSLETASTPSSSPRTAEIDAETGAIHDVLGRYRSALSALDSKAVQQVWPTVNQRTLVRAFGQVQEQDVTFLSCALDVKGRLAQALCVGTTSFVPKVGKRSSQFGPSQWNVTLRKERSGAWQIEEVQAH